MTSPQTIVLVVGARPNFMKVAPVQRALEQAAPDIRLVLIHTGQHYDEQMSSVFFGELGMPEPDVTLGVGSSSHGEQTAKALAGIEAVILEQRPGLAVVAGDVNSTLAGALAAVKLDVPVAHLEAGLRSYDRTMPEEHNRRLTDAVSSVLLTHSEDCRDNLTREGIDPSWVHFVGNTMIDSLFSHLPHARARKPWEGFGLKRESIIVFPTSGPSSGSFPRASGCRDSPPSASGAPRKPLRSTSGCVLRHRAVIAPEPGLEVGNRHIELTAASAPARVEFTSPATTARPGRCSRITAWIRKRLGGLLAVTARAIQASRPAPAFRLPKNTLNICSS